MRKNCSRALGYPGCSYVKRHLGQEIRSLLWTPGMPRSLTSSHHGCCLIRCEQSFLPQLVMLRRPETQDPVFSTQIVNAYSASSAKSSRLTQRKATRTLLN